MAFNIFQAIQSLASAYLSYPHGSRHTLLLRAAAPLLSFRYEAPLKPNEIRLVRVPPYLEEVSSTTPSPTFTIHTFPLENVPPYIALSYTWGDPLLPAMTPVGTNATPPQQQHQQQRVITLDGKPFPVTVNLLEAFTRIAAARPGAHVWIDGICINQSDPEERASQVGLMNTIYSLAEETIVWLGEATDAVGRALSKIEAMGGPGRGAEERITDWGRRQAYGDAFVADDPEVLRRNGIPPMTEADWDDLAEVFGNRAWFRRVWIIQEVALSRNSPTVLIGPHAIPWFTLGNAALVLVGSSVLTGLYALQRGAAHGPLVMGISHASNLHILREWCRGDDSPYKDILASTDFASGMAGEDTLGGALLNILMVSKVSVSTVRQDKIYGLLGIINHIARTKGLPLPSIEVDYVSPPEKVLARLALHLYVETGSLSLLSLAGEASRSGGATPNSLPTWLPTFEGHHVPILGPNFTNLRPYDASALASTITSAAASPLFRIGEDDKTLHVKVSAPYLGSIEEIGESWNEFMHGNFLKSMTMLLHCGGDTYKPTGEPIVEAFWRTLILDSNLSTRPAPAHMAESFGAWFRILACNAIQKSFLANRHLHDIFDPFEPLFTLADSRDTTGLLPTSRSLLEYLYQLGAFNDPTIKVMTTEQQFEYIRSLGRDASTYEGLLRLILPIQRQLVRTVRGALCLAPSIAEIGDKIMIVKGCATPLVLRRVKSMPDTYKVIGDVYVHGVMFGEHITEDTHWRDISLV